jgi:hypothetical protein
LKSDGKLKNGSFVIPPPTIRGPHDLQPHPLALGGHEESEDEPVSIGAVSYWGAPGAEVLDSLGGHEESEDEPGSIGACILLGGSWS